MHGDRVDIELIQECHFDLRFYLYCLWQQPDSMPIHSFIHSIIHSVIHSYIQSFIHSSIHLDLCRVHSLSIKKGLLILQHKENMEARMKFGDNPEKFLESEVDLDEEIRKLQAVTATPDLYPELVKLGAIPTLATLLSHENGDIVAAVIELLRDLTDSDAVEELVCPIGKMPALHRLHARIEAAVCHPHPNYPVQTGTMWPLSSSFVTH